MFYLNGQMISSDNKGISLQDRGFLLGDGLFETFCCYQQKPIALEAHWKRLKKGADYLNIPFSMTATELHHIILKLITGQIEEKIGIRITLTRGPAERGIALPAEAHPTLLIHTFVIEENPDPKKVCISSSMTNEKSMLCRFKTLNYLEKIIALQEAKARGCNEAILLNTERKIVSVTTANIFLVKNNCIFTPPLHDGVLPGITRQIILNLIDNTDYICEEKSLTVKDLEKADEIFITNSLIGIKIIDEIIDCNYLSKKFLVTDHLILSYENFLRNFAEEHAP